MVPEAMPLIHIFSRTMYRMVLMSAGKRARNSASIINRTDVYGTMAGLVGTFGPGFRPQNRSSKRRAINSLYPMPQGQQSVAPCLHGDTMTILYNNQAITYPCDSPTAGPLKGKPVKTKGRNYLMGRNPFSRIMFSINPACSAAVGRTRVNVCNLGLRW